VSALKRGFALWRIGVCGASQGLSVPAAEMCEAIGERLGRHATAVVVHTGLKRAGAGRSLAADWHFIEGVRRTCGDNLPERVETVLADGEASAASGRGRGEDGVVGDAEMFIEGSVNRIKARTREARRFRFVSSLDAMLALGGGFGTRQQLTLAAAIDIPILPVPCFGGQAARFWQEHRPDMMAQFGIDEATAAAWEKEPSTAEEISGLANDMLDRLLTRLPRRAFIIMPYAAELDTLYDLVIEPAVTGLGDVIQRLDRLHRPGAITQQIEDGIRSADYCVVVLDGMRPNVLYEMGFAHALRKPLVLVMRKGEVSEATEVPFDISAFQRIDYVRPDRNMLETLATALRHVSQRGPG
jgi:hypothetical protein